MDEKLFSELNANLLKLSVLYIILGALITALGVLVLGVSVYEEEDATYGTVVLVLGVVLIFLAVFLRLYYKNFNRTAIKMNRVEDAEFFGDYLIEREYTEGEHTSTNKVYYKWLVKIRETKNYLFLYNSRVTAIAVEKNSIPPNELETIRSLLGKAPKTTPQQNDNKEI